MAAELKTDTALAAIVAGTTVAHKNPSIQKIARHVRAIDSSEDLSEVGDAIPTCLIPTNAVISAINITNSEFDTHSTPTLTYDLALAYTGIGQGQKGKAWAEDIDEDALVSDGTELQAARTTPANVRFSAKALSTAGQEAWALMGLTADPGGLFVLKLKTTAVIATAGDGTLVTEVVYTD